MVCATPMLSKLSILEPYSASLPPQQVAPGDVLAEIETDKATLAFENQDEGFVARILKPAGSKDVKASGRSY